MTSILLTRVHDGTLNAVIALTEPAGATGATGVTGTGRDGRPAGRSAATCAIHGQPIPVPVSPKPRETIRSSPVPLLTVLILIA